MNPNTSLLTKLPVGLQNQNKTVNSGGLYGNPGLSFNPGSSLPGMPAGTSYIGGPSQLGGGGQAGFVLGSSWGAQPPPAAATPAVDPAAAARAASAAKFGKLRDSTLQTIGGNASSGFSSAGRSLSGAADSLFNKLYTGQKGIDRARENTELNRMNGVRDILSFVRRGLQQGGARLSSMNAMDSSGVEGISRAYSDLGNDKSRNLSNDAFLQNRDIDTQQDDLNLMRTQGLTDFDRTKEEQVGSISNQVWQQLMELNSQAADMEAAGIDVEGEKNRIVSSGIQALNGIDSGLDKRLAGIGPASMDAIRKNARGLQAGGSAGTNPFNIDYEGQSVSGPATSQFPLMVKYNKRD